MVRRKPTWHFERAAWKEGFRQVAGLDEVGRGCLAGPVVAAAVVLDPVRRVRGIDDSKRLTARQRERLYGEIVLASRSWAVAFVGSEEIDRTNILRATRKAMLEAVRSLPHAPDCLLVDAVDLTGCGLPCHSIIHGDGRSVSIAAASVLAKVTRDRFMVEADTRYPGYGFASHKGYGTRLHMEALRSKGVTPLHRVTFYGVGSFQPALPLV